LPPRNRRNANVDTIRALRKCIHIGTGWRGEILLTPIHYEGTFGADGAAPVETAAPVTT